MDDVFRYESMTCIWKKCGEKDTFIYQMLQSFIDAQHEYEKPIMRIKFMEVLIDVSKKHKKSHWFYRNCQIYGVCAKSHSIRIFDLNTQEWSKIECNNHLQIPSLFLEICFHNGIFYAIDFKSLAISQMFDVNVNLIK